MQIFLWLYLVTSLKMVSTKTEPLSFTATEEEILSPLFSHYRKTEPSQLHAEFLLDDDTRSSKKLKEAEFLVLSAFLKQLLQETGPWKPPLAIITESAENFDIDLDFPENQHAAKKRSRYYRRYPWKRQNSRSRGSYDYDSAQYLCALSKEDVFRLLVALHDARQGNKAKDSRIRFCNRHRPAGTVFTNLRFIGR